MLVRPHAGQQGDPAGAADGRLFAAAAGDAASIGLGVVQPALELGVVTQRFVVLQLNAIDTDEQGLGLRRRRSCIAAREQQTCQQ